MIEIEDGCVDCGKPCLGNACPYRHEVHMYCDRCKEEEEVLYEWDDEQLCGKCVLKDIPEVEYPDEW